MAYSEKSPEWTYGKPSKEELVKLIGEFKPIYLIAHMFHKESVSISNRLKGYGIKASDVKTKKVAEEVKNGLTNTDIMDKYGISLATVERHRKRAKENGLL